MMPDGLYTEALSEQSREQGSIHLEELQFWAIKTASSRRLRRKRFTIMSPGSHNAGFVVLLAYIKSPKSQSRLF